MIPSTYDEWRRCIEVDCGVVIEPRFIAQRLAELRDAGNDRTAQFVRLYGDPHRLRVIGWFEQAGSGG